MTEEAGAPGRADPGPPIAFPLLWIAGIAAVALSAAAFVLWTRDGAGILLDMVLALCV